MLGSYCLFLSLSVVFSCEINSGLMETCNRILICPNWPMNDTLPLNVKNSCISETVTQITKSDISDPRGVK